MGDYLITTGGSDCFRGTYLWLACVQPQSVVGTPVRGHSHHGGDKDVVRSVSSIWSILFVWFVWSIWEDRSRGLSPSRRDQNVECLLFNVELIGMKYGSSRLRKHSIDVLRQAQHERETPVNSLAAPFVLSPFDVLRTGLSKPMVSSSNRMNGGFLRNLLDPTNQIDETNQTNLAKQIRPISQSASAGTRRSHLALLCH